MKCTEKTNISSGQINEELKKLLEENVKLNKMLRSAFSPYGAWVCPKCGAVYGPGVAECCRCNPPIRYEIICRAEEVV